MTFQQYIHDFLCKNGMSDKQATAVIEAAMKDPILESMEGRWSDKVEDYPPVMLPVIVTSIKTVALKWIDANFPLAWYRVMFV